MEQQQDNELDFLNLDTYHAVNGLFFKHSQEILLTIYKNSIRFNATAISKLNTEYVHILINDTEKKLIAIPSQEWEKESIRWCVTDRALKPKRLVSPILFAMIIDMMNWDATYRYRIMGKFFSTEAENVLIFDLNAPEIFKPHTDENGSTRISKTAYYCNDWNNRFGVPFSEIKQAQINHHPEYTTIELPEGKRL